MKSLSSEVRRPRPDYQPGSLKKFIHPYKYERGVNVPTLPLENSKGVDPGGVVYLSGGRRRVTGAQ